MREDLQHLEITDDLWKERVNWRAKIHEADPNSFGNEL